MQKGDKILESEVEKSRQQILDACRTSINKETIMGQLRDGQVKGIRENINRLDQAHHLKKIDEY